MLDDVTKKRINTLRQILVGKLPDPKAQVEQITNALIYKFMNDMDNESLSMGGKATYFSNKFEKYSWKNLMDAQTSGVQKLSLYKTNIVHPFHAAVSRLNHIEGKSHLDQIYLLRHI